MESSPSLFCIMALCSTPGYYGGGDHFSTFESPSSVKENAPSGILTQEKYQLKMLTDSIRSLESQPGVHRKPCFRDTKRQTFVPQPVGRPWVGGEGEAGPNSALLALRAQGCGPGLHLHLFLPHLPVREGCGQVVHPFSCQRNHLKKDLETLAAHLVPCTAHTFLTT